jgi:uncharacterized coiled-coil protein SlyX
MKVKHGLMTSLAVAAFAACSPPDANKPTPTAGETAAAKFDRTKQEAKEATRAAKDYTYAQKNEFVANMKDELAQMNQEMDRLAAKVESSSAATKDEAKARLQALREKTTD